MKNRILCPKCGGSNVAFCGLKPDGKGNWFNSWECLEPDCENEWATEIDAEAIREFNG